MSPQLFVADIERAIEFYTKKLGFDIDFRYEDFYAGIIKDGCSIHLKADKSSIEKRKNRKDHDDLEITFSVDGIESLYEELSNRSVQFSQTLRDMPYGKEFYVVDPDNNIISFLEI
jgi:catechol 2,3-dioxygenase-like lactoylglutathione lyase family enzyme